jgi:phospholipase C
MMTPMTVNRRTFVKGALGASGALLLGDLGDVGKAEAASTRAHRGLAALPPPAKSGIEHVIVVMMENRSFDHFLGWLPHADGKQAGLSYADPAGAPQKTYHQTQFDGCGFTDPDHSYGGGRLQYNGGKMDGFLSDNANDRFAISYYTAKDRPFMSKLALTYTTCDRYFCSILGPTYPNRFFQHAAQTDRLDDSLTLCTLPTIWDQLNQHGGPTGAYYFSDVPFVALWGAKYGGISRPFSRFLSDVAAGTLPNVSYVDPKFAGEATGTSADDHPLADIRAGDAFLSQVFHAVTTGPGWDKTVLVINYDEWGGFFDHVVPRRITAGVPVSATPTGATPTAATPTGATPTGGTPTGGIDTDVNAAGKVLSGFRVPCIVVSPFSRIGPSQPAVNHTFYDHTSVLKLIEWRWGLHPLTQRDASHAPSDPGNLATLLTFSRPVTKVPKLPVLPAFTPTGCAAAGTTTTEPPGINPADFKDGVKDGAGSGHDSWTNLAASALMEGWTARRV